MLVLGSGCQARASSVDHRWTRMVLVLKANILGSLARLGRPPSEPWLELYRVQAPPVRAMCLMAVLRWTPMALQAAVLPIHQDHGLLWTQMRKVAEAPDIRQMDDLRWTIIAGLLWGSLATCAALAHINHRLVLHYLEGLTLRALPTTAALVGTVSQVQEEQQRCCRAASDVRTWGDPIFRRFDQSLAYLWMSYFVVTGVQYQLLCTNVCALSTCMAWTQRASIVHLAQHPTL